MCQHPFAFLLLFFSGPHFNFINVEIDCYFPIYSPEVKGKCLTHQKINVKVFLSEQSRLKNQELQFKAFGITGERKFTRLLGMPSVQRESLKIYKCTIRAPRES